MTTKPMTPDIFLCHSKKDVAFVRRLARDLHDLRAYAWFDEWELGPGDSLHDSIARALEDAAHIGVVVSPASVKSAWVRKELNQALAREGRKPSKSGTAKKRPTAKSLIVPLRIGDATMPSFLEDRLYLDFGADYESALAQLAAHLHDLDRQRLMELLVAAPPPSLAAIETLLQHAGWEDAVALGSKDWSLLTSLLRRHGMNIEGDRLSLYDPLTRRRMDAS